MCQPMAHRHAYYKYITITVILATSLEFPRFFEMKLEDGQSKEGKLQFQEASPNVFENMIIINTF